MKNIENVFKDRKQSFKSILRLTSISQQMQQDSVKQPQIDQIRRKLKILDKVNQKCSPQISNKQNNQRSCKKSGDMLCKLLNKERKRKEDILTQIKKQKNQFRKDINRHKYLISSGSENKIQFRKIKTQYQSVSAEKNVKNKTVKQQPNQTLKELCNSLDSTNENKVDMQKYLIVKSEKIACPGIALKKIRISYELKRLQQQMNNTLLQNKIEEKDNKLLHNYTKIFRAQKNLIKEEIQKASNSTKITQNKSLGPKIIAQSQFRIKKSHKSSLKFQPPSCKYSDFIKFVALSNQIVSFFPPVNYKFYIFKGNNEDLIRRALKRRKWLQTTKIQQANFIWSPKRQQKFYNLAQKLKICKENKRKQQNYLLLCSCKKQLQQDCNCGFNRFIKFKSFSQLNLSYQLEEYCDGFRNGYKFTFKPQNIYKIQNNFVRMHNHLVHHQQLAYKKLLFSNLKQYLLSKNMNPFQYIPLTFHIQSSYSEEWKNFSKNFYQRKLKQPEEKCFWIIKPSQNTNRGTGIKVQSDIHKIMMISQQIINQSQYGNSSVIIQEYIKPLLYNKRKFDIRCYVLVTVIDKKVKVYWYQQGYCRTSSKVFNIFKTQNKFIHLTNDAIQKYSSDYGKYQPGNKISFEILSKYISANFQDKNFYTDVYPQMIKISKLTFESTFYKLHDTNKGICFQIFGLDFMIDEDLKVWLIQVNRNPCLQTSTSLLNKIITQMLQNTFRIALDPILSPSHQVLQVFDKNIEDSFQINKFTLILNRQMPQRQQSGQNYSKSDSQCD